MLVFDRQQKRLQRDRAASHENSAHFDFMRNDIADGLCDRLLDIKNHRFPRVLDFGAGPGTLLPLLARRNDVTHVTLLDSSPKMIERARRTHEELLARAAGEGSGGLRPCRLCSRGVFPVLD